MTVLQSKAFKDYDFSFSGAAFARTLFPEFFFSVAGTFLNTIQWALIRTLITKTVNKDEVRFVELDIL